MPFFFFFFIFARVHILFGFFIVTGRLKVPSENG